MPFKPWSFRTKTVLSIGLILLGVTVLPLPTIAESHTERVDLTFETNPNGEAWNDPENTDFGYVDFSMFSPDNNRENAAVVTQVGTPDTPPEPRHVIVNRNAAGEVGWLYLRFDEPQSNPRLVFWLEPRDEQVDESGNSNVLIVRGYDLSNDRVYNRRSQITAGGYIVIDISSAASTADISRVAVTVRPFSEPGFSRFYVSRVSFDAPPPDISLSISQSQPGFGDAISIRANVDAAGEITEYEWFLDGTPYQLPSDSSSHDVIRPHLSSGSHNVSVRVVDRHGLQGTASQTIFIQRPSDERNGDVSLLWVGVVVGLLLLIGVIVIIRRSS